MNATTSLERVPTRAAVQRGPRAKLSGLQLRMAVSYALTTVAAVMFGFPRLAALLGRQPGDSRLVDSLLNELATFTGGDWEQEDDVTLVVVKRAAPVLAAAT